MTPTEAKEWAYHFTERLGILCGAEEATHEQLEMAKTDADAAVVRMREFEETLAGNKQCNVKSQSSHGQLCVR